MTAARPIQTSAQGLSSSFERVASAAVAFAASSRWRTGIFGRISAASNSVYAANTPVFTYGPSDEYPVAPLDSIGQNWTCVGMVYPL